MTVSERSNRWGKKWCPDLTCTCRDSSCPKQKWNFSFSSQSAFLQPAEDVVLKWVTSPLKDRAGHSQCEPWASEMEWSACWGFPGCVITSSHLTITSQIYWITTSQASQLGQVGVRKPWRGYSWWIPPKWSALPCSDKIDLHMQLLKAAGPQKVILVNSWRLYDSAAPPLVTTPQAPS